MKRGFSLIELIVVIIIVGILASVGMTQYSTIAGIEGRIEGRSPRYHPLCFHPVVNQ